MSGAGLARSDDERLGSRVIDATNSMFGLVVDLDFLAVLFSVPLRIFSPV